MRNLINNGLIVIGLLLCAAGLVAIAPDLTSVFAASQVTAAPDNVVVIGKIEPTPTSMLAPGAGMEAFLEPVVTPTAATLPEQPQSAPTDFPTLQENLEGPQGIVQTASPTPTPVNPEPPVRLVIPRIGLDAPIVPAESQLVELDGQQFQQWVAPNKFAAGWHTTSARLGERGNTVLNGHHNIWGEVFKDLVKLEVGDQIMIGSETKIYKYRVVETMILPERGQPPEVRLANAAWLMPTTDERVTLITCWPYESNTHRLIIVAMPEGPGEKPSSPWR